jgi:hypothetical protein
MTRANATLGTSHYKMSLTLTSGGTYTVGAAISGGQALNFVSDANPSLMVLGTTRSDGQF